MNRLADDLFAIGEVTLSSNPGVNFANQRVAVKLHHVQLKAK